MRPRSRRAPRRDLDAGDRLRLPPAALVAAEDAAAVENGHPPRGRPSVRPSVNGDSPLPRRNRRTTDRRSKRRRARRMRATASVCPFVSLGYRNAHVHVVSCANEEVRSCQRDQLFLLFERRERSAREGVLPPSLAHSLTLSLPPSSSSPPGKARLPPPPPPRVSPDASAATMSKPDARVQYAEMRGGYGSSWEVDLWQAPCRAPGCCLASVFCPPCVAYAIRRRVLYNGTPRPPSTLARGRGARD